MTDSTDRNLNTNEPTRSHALRALIAIVALAVIAFCAWSAVTYVQGGDPLAFLNGGAFQTTADDPNASDKASLELESSTRSVTADDVKARIAKLSYGDLDLALASDQVGVIISDGTVWVENASAVDAATAIDAAAHRAAALAKWARKQKVGFKSIVWIQEDMVGDVRIALAYPVSRKSIDEYVDQILAGCTGYAISGDAYAALDNPNYAQQAGLTPTLPDGNAITVIAETTQAGEVLNESGQTYSVLSTGEGSAGESSSATGSSAGTASSSGVTSGSGSSASGSASSGSSSASGTSSTSGSDSTSSDERSGISVSITVDASIVGAGSSSASVSLGQGATVYDALKATGVSMNASNTQYGIYVSSIGGLAEKEHGATSGWMYSVNGVTPMTACSNYKLSNGDKIVWYYVTND